MHQPEPTVHELINRLAGTIREAQYQAARTINREQLRLYYTVGALLSAETQRAK